MRTKPILFLLVMVIPAVFLTACGKISPEADAPPALSAGQIYLYGERHGVQDVMEKQLELWGEYYRTSDMRHLFVELPYYTAEWLNIWMKSDGDGILDELYNDWAGAAIHIPYAKTFYRAIKTEYPETVFHGTDVGHQYNTSGKRFLEYLEDNGLTDSEQYLLAKETVGQGERYYQNASGLAYRVDKKTENFIREFDKLGGQSVMGIYGSAHTEFGLMAGQSFPTLAERLKERYGAAVHSETLSWLRTDVIIAGGKEYEASYFGEQDLTGFGIEFTSRAFWRLENAYDDFKDKAKTGDVLPYGNYPAPVETGQVFVIDYRRSDGSAVRMYYRSDGNTWQGLPATEEFSAD